ncbi:DUF4333 domain-containing protein [Actinomycetospora sp. OC33-EN08]|uniref:DUF4333 domain-containing protein n=1 Tax=Actinomycetospora aurantiaca TaxID=3129233 RepID=A0ABU8MT22_9PSEU
MSRSTTPAPKRSSTSRWGSTLALAGAAAYLLICLAQVTGLDELVATHTVPAAVVAEDAAGLVPSGSATCADDLTAEVGATIDCSVVGAETPLFVVRATVTSVDGEDVAYEFRRPE